MTKLPKIEQMDSPLSFVNGHVLAPTAGYVGDAGTYQGHVVMLNAGTDADRTRLELSLRRSVGIDGSGNLPAGAIGNLGRTGIVIDPGTRNLLFATGNGTARRRGEMALIMLDPNATKMVGNWTPTNNAELNRQDLDVGSTSPVLLGDGYIAQGGKDGTIRLLTMDIVKGAEPHQAENFRSCSRRAALSSSPPRQPQKSTTRLSCLPRKVDGAAEAPPPGRLAGTTSSRKPGRT